MALPRLPIREIAHSAFLTFLRFPFTLLSAVVGTTVAFILIGHERGEYTDLLAKLGMVSAMGLILFFVLELVAERESNRPAFRWGLMAIGTLLLVGYFFWLPNKVTEKEIVRYLMWMLALHLAASFAAFLNWRLENGFWQFNKSLFLRLLTALLYSGVLYIGLILAILALDHLFDLDINSRIYSRLWFFMAGIFNTWFFLAGVPRPTALERVTEYPKGLKLFTQFVLLPLVTLYLFILYGYMAKILIGWEWPRGWVSYLVLGFSTAGIFSLLLIHPIRQNQGNRWISTYAKWFYRALFPLLVLLLLAIWRRVRDYGITENRYIVLALALWLLVVACYFLFSRQKNIKFIPFTLALISFLGAVGPWSAFAVSEHSQTVRLHGILTEHGLLVNEKVQKAKQPVSAQVEFEISSILSYLEDHHQYASVRPWFGGQMDSLFRATDTRYGAPSASEVMDLMDLKYRYSPELQEVNYYSLYAKDDEVKSIKGYDYLVNFREFLGSERQVREYALGEEKFKIVMLPNRNEVQLIFASETLVVHLENTVKKHRKSQFEVPAQALFFETKGQRYDIGLQVTDLAADRNRGSKSFQLYKLEGWLLVKVKS